MGSFHLESGYGKLPFSESKGLRVTTERVPFNGTLVVALINFSDPSLLVEALSFGGRQHIPVDFVETNYEQHDRAEHEDAGHVRGGDDKAELQGLLKRGSGGPSATKLKKVGLVDPVAHPGEPAAYRAASRHQFLRRKWQLLSRPRLHRRRDDGQSGHPMGRTPS